MISFINDRLVFLDLEKVLFFCVNEYLRSVKTRYVTFKVLGCENVGSFKRIMSVKTLSFYGAYQFSVFK